MSSLVSWRPFCRGWWAGRLLERSPTVPPFLCLSREGVRKRGRVHLAGRVVLRPLVLSLGSNAAPHLRRKNCLDRAHAHSGPFNTLSTTAIQDGTLETRPRAPACGWTSGVHCVRQRRVLMSFLAHPIPSPPLVLNDPSLSGCPDRSRNHGNQGRVSADSSLFFVRSPTRRRRRDPNPASRILRRATSSVMCAVKCS